MKIAVLLHGSGVYDGTEIQEAVLSLLAIAETGHEYACIAPDIDQHHVVNHLDGSEMEESRNVLIESARIARGEVTPLSEAKIEDYDALLMPGGFGTAKNFTKWAFQGPDGPINEDVRSFLIGFAERRIPIAALCMSPTTLAKAFEGTEYSALLSVGTTEENSPYDIQGIHEGMSKTGARAEQASVRSISVDEDLKIICAPCYMMEANISEINSNIRTAVGQLIALAEKIA